jgi:hypothetical protein
MKVPWDDEMVTTEFLISDSAPLLSVNDQDGMFTLLFEIRDLKEAM